MRTFYKNKAKGVKNGPLYRGLADKLSCDGIDLEKLMDKEEQDILEARERYYLAYREETKGLSKEALKTLDHLSI